MLRSPMALIAGTAAAVMALAACSSSSSGGSGNAGSGTTLTGACAPYSAYAGHKGTVTMFGSILSPESDSLNKSWAEFQTCTGITIKYTGEGQWRKCA
jgi:alpha-glucoside transport system substrate-binding protein